MKTAQNKSTGPGKREKENESEHRMNGKEMQHWSDELRYIAGVLDMLWLINEGDAWEMRGEDVLMVISDARWRALELSKQL